MAKSGPKPRGRPRASEAGEAKEALLRAATEVLREDGVVGASARTIAERAGVNSAAVFYHYGSVHDLLLAALDASSADRLERYREATAGVDDLATLIRAIKPLILEDEASGHIAVMATMVGGGAAIPGLGAQIAERVDPWIALADEVTSRVAVRLGLGAVIDPLAVARLVVALALGVEMLGQLRPDAADSTALVEQADRAITLFQPLFGGAS